MHAARTIAVAAAVLVSGLGIRAAADRLQAPSVELPATILIHGGSFQMGSDDLDVAAAADLCRAQPDDAPLCQAAVFSDEQPRHGVYVSAFRIDRTEVAQRDYQRCMQHGVCPPPRVLDSDARLALPDLPVVGITAAEAETFCGWCGGRLPTEAEWERAARGSTTRRFPWGQHWNSRVANHGLSGNRPGPLDGYDYASPVSAFRDGRSPYGLLNMAGNVWEWTGDRYDAAGYAASAAVDPHGPATGDELVIRGGSWRSPPATLRVTQRASLKRTESRPDVGFRCAYNVP
jgi:formylglycine-generating enzyme required for sulfatase activity